MKPSDNPLEDQDSLFWEILNNACEKYRSREALTNVEEEILRIGMKKGLVDGHGERTKHPHWNSNNEKPELDSMC